MSFERAAELLPKVARNRPPRSPEELRRILPALAGLAATDEAVLRAEPLLLELLGQEQICGACRGYDRCGKMGDARGMYHRLALYHGELTVETGYCQPYKDHLTVQRAAKYDSYSLRTQYDRQLTFANFPEQQKVRKPKLYSVAYAFAHQFTPGDQMKGLYIFGPAGVGKTHLLHAMLNRLEERRVPCVFVRADSLFDRLRSMIGENRDIEPALNLFSTVSVLAIDEIGQERPNEFTLEKLFRIVNQRFTAKLPTLYASNFAPPDLYGRMHPDMLALTDPLKSRIIGSSRVAYLDGDDYRITHMELLDD